VNSVLCTLFRAYTECNGQQVAMNLLRLYISSE